MDEARAQAQRWVIDHEVVGTLISASPANRIYSFNKDLFAAEKDWRFEFIPPQPDPDACQSCDRCASALREAGEVRAALGQPVIVGASRAADRPAGGRDVWTLLAAAAAVAMLFYGVRQLTTRQEMILDTGAVRSETADSLHLSVEAAEEGQVLLEWPPHSEADRYRIEIVRSDGLPVLESETADRKILLQHVREALLVEPVRLPVLDVADLEAPGMDLLSHQKFSPSGLRATAMWLVRLLIGVARPRARGR